jgi:hypothetical protein
VELRIARMCENAAFHNPSHELSTGIDLNYTLNVFYHEYVTVFSEKVSPALIPIHVPVEKP